MEKQRLLLAEGNEELALALEEGLRSQYILRICRDGQTALELTKTFRPDVLVLDMMLPGMDGVSLLENITAAHLEPMVLATTRYYNDYMLENLDRFGVGYLIVKPCDVSAAIARIGDLTGRIRRPKPVRPEPGVTVSNLLRELRIRARLKGYPYLKDAILIMAERPGLAIVKELYAEIAQRYGTHFKQVEKCIRTAIEEAWNYRDDTVWKTYFPPDAEGVWKRPTNGEFICRLAEYLRNDEEYSGRR